MSLFNASNLRRCHPRAAPSCLAETPPPPVELGAGPPSRPAFVPVPSTRERRGNATLISLRRIGQSLRGGVLCPGEEAPAPPASVSALEGTWACACPSSELAGSLQRQRRVGPAFRGGDGSSLPFLPLQVTAHSLFTLGTKQRGLFSFSDHGDRWGPLPRQ